MKMGSVKRVGFSLKKVLSVGPGGLLPVVRMDPPCLVHAWCVGATTGVSVGHEEQHGSDGAGVRGRGTVQAPAQERRC